MIVLSPTKLKKGTKVLLRWTGVDYEELKVIFVEKNKVILDDGTILKKDNIKWQGKYNYDKKKWEWYWKAQKGSYTSAFATKLKEITEGDFIKTYDETGKLIRFGLTKEAHKEWFWFLRDPHELMTEHGYIVEKSVAESLEHFIEGDWPDVYYWFDVATSERKEYATEIIKWMLGPLKEVMLENREKNTKAKDLSIDGMLFTSLSFGSLVEKIVNKEITATMGKDVLRRMFDGEKLEAIVKDDKYKISSGNEMTAFVDKVLEANPDQVGELKEGKDKILGWLVGQVMKESRGKANAGEVKEMIIERIKS